MSIPGQEQAPQHGTVANLKAPASPAEVLRAAADLIEPEGRWTQGAMWRGKSGHPVKSLRYAVCFCAMGALDAVVGDNPFDLARVRAGHILAESLVDDDCEGRYVEFNDAPGRTQAEVVAALRKAAALADGTTDPMVGNVSSAPAADDEPGMRKP